MKDQLARPRLGPGDPRLDPTAGRPAGVRQQSHLTFSLTGSMIVLAAVIARV